MSKLKYSANTFATTILRRALMHMMFLTGCGRCMECDLRAVRAEHGVPAGAHPEGVQAVGIQAGNGGAGSVDALHRLPDAILDIILGRGPPRPTQSEHRECLAIRCALMPMTSMRSVSMRANLRYSSRCWSVGWWSSDSLQKMVASL